MNQRPTGYESVALPLSYTGWSNKNLTFKIFSVNTSPNPRPELDPKLREKLLQETRNPLFGPRRLLWFILFGSACLGLVIMLARTATGDMVPLNDLGVQLGAFLIFGSLILFDRKKNKD